MWQFRMGWLVSKVRGYCSGNPARKTVLLTNFWNSLTYEFTNNETTQKSFLISRWLAMLALTAHLWLSLQEDLETVIGGWGGKCNWIQCYLKCIIMYIKPSLTLPILCWILTCPSLPGNKVFVCNKSMSLVLNDGYRFLLLWLNRKKKSKKGKKDDLSHDVTIGILIREISVLYPGEKIVLWKC